MALAARSSYLIKVQGRLYVDAIANERLYIELLTPSALDTDQDALAVLEVWKHCLPDYLPEQIGNYEPITLSLSSENVAEWLRGWKWPVRRLRGPSATRRFSLTLNTYSHVPPALQHARRVEDGWQLESTGLEPARSIEADRHLVKLRRSYEPYVTALARTLMMPAPSWSHRPASKTTGRRIRGALQKRLDR
jgi:hypothetical protein